MPNAQDAFWFKSQFQPEIEKAIAGTPFSVDMVTAFACQETGEIWPALRRQGLPTSRILELCVGDTIDASATGGRRAFPKNKAELLQSPQGDRMFEIARQGLVDMAGYIPAYRGAASRPDKFCHGFGIFQLDLQFFKNEPDYFLSRRYADFDVALAKCVGEMKSALKRIGWQAKTSLSDAEMAGVAIAYNTGRYDPAKGLKQGYFDGKQVLRRKLLRVPAARQERQLPGGRGGAVARRARVADGGEEVAKEEGGEDDIDQEDGGTKGTGEEGGGKEATGEEGGGEEASGEESAGEESSGEEEGRAICRQPSRREAKSEAQGRDRRCGREASQGPRGRREAALTARLRPAPARFARSRRRKRRGTSRGTAFVSGFLKPAVLVEQVAGAADVGLGLLHRPACRETPATGAGDGWRRSRRSRPARR